MTDPITLPAVVTGQHVREVMTRYGLTQQMLADMLGIQRTQVGRWVAGGGLSQESAAAFREVAARLASGSVPVDIVLPSPADQDAEAGEANVPALIRAKAAQDAGERAGLPVLTWYLAGSLAYEAAQGMPAAERMTELCRSIGDDRAREVERDLKAHGLWPW